MRRYIAIVVLLFSGALCGQIPMPEGKEFALIPIPDAARRLIERDGSGLLCGPYFYMASKTKKPDDMGRYTLTLFAFMRDGNLELPFVGVDKFVTLVDSSKTIPTATFSKRKSGSASNVAFHWTFRISPADLKAAQACIADPER